MLGITVLLPLKDSRPISAQAEFDHALQLFRHGYLKRSQQEAENGYRQFALSDSEWATRFFLLEAEAMLWRGLYTDVQHLLNSEHPSLHDAEQNIQELVIEGEGLARLHLFAQASQRFAEAEQLCSVSLYNECGDVFRAQGISAMEQGQQELALNFYLESLNFARLHGDKWSESTALLNVGFICIQSGHFDEAVDWSMQAFEAGEALGEENQSQAALGNLGWAYFELGDRERALDLFLDVKRRANQLGNLRDEVKWLTTTGYTYRDLGELDKAAECYRQAIALARKLDSKQDIVDILEDLTDTFIDEGVLDQANAYVRQAAPLVHDSGNRLDELDILLAQGRIAAARRENKQAETIFATVMHDPASQTSMRLGAGHELAKLYEAEGNPSAAERTYKATLVAFEAARDELKKEDSKLPFLANATRIYDDYISFLVSHGKVEEALATADSSRAQTLKQGLGVGVVHDNRRANPHRAALARSTGATLLFYWLGEKQSYLWSITPKRTKIFTLPSQHEIAARVKNYRNALLGMNDPIEAGNEDGRVLYQMLVAPAASMIRPDSQVVVLADGELSKLNFETLIVSTPQPHYWIEDATLFSAPSLRLMANAHPARAGSGKLLLMGNAVSAGPDYPELPMAETEMRLIEARFPRTEATVFARAQANAGSYLASNPEQYSYIHFVTHAVASSTDPLDSAILLSRGAGGGDGFKLYARQILTRPIRARLVTISACYGSGMRSYAGEGLVGLSWAFLHAGAHNVIGALWEVSDDSTPRLMDALYQGLQTGQTPAIALRSAKLALLHSEGNFRKPFFWAPFQIYSGL